MKKSAGGRFNEFLRNTYIIYIHLYNKMCTYVRITVIKPIFQTVIIIRCVESNLLHVLMTTGQVIDTIHVSAP